MPKRVKPGSRFYLRVFVENCDSTALDDSIAPARLSYGWSNSTVEELRTPLLHPLLPGEHGLFTIAVQAPDLPGRYDFFPRIVLEGVRWIDAARTSSSVDVNDDAVNPGDDINRFEERVTSQNGEDGILRELLLRLGSPARFVVEIGAGDGTENNSAQLIERYGFAACLVEADAERTERLTLRHAARSEVAVVAALVDAESVRSTLAVNGVPPEPDLVSIDIDGNDYHVWRALAPSVRPRIVVIEYNASRGPEADWIMPYDPAHRWTGNDYFGASLSALERLGSELGYALVGTDSCGVNAFFVRNDLLERARFPQRTAAEAYHALRSAAKPVAASTELRDAYTRSYYVRDCGGYADFGYDDPLAIADHRLRTTATFAEIRPGRRSLDLGCGRGEIAAYLGARGWLVDAVDYSADAIALAHEHLDRTRVPAERVRLYNQDLNEFAFEPQAYDLIVAADVVEHLSSGELDRLYRRASGALAQGGLFVVHTFPNSWYYDYEWPRLRRLAEQRGERWPDDPRSSFEHLMHINEQSPRTLAHQLRSHFSTVRVWVGDPLDPFRFEVGTSARGDLRGSPDIFAVAGHGPLEDVAASDAFLDDPLPNSERAKIAIAAPGRPRGRADGGWDIALALDNGSSTTLSSTGRAPVLLAYHWLDDAGKTVVFDGRRTPLGGPLRPGASTTRPLRVDAAPPRASIVRLTLVQEGVAWFDGDGCYIDVVAR